MVADHHEPAALFFGEALPARFLLRNPGFEVGVDTLGEGDKFVILVHGEAHEGDEVGEDAAAASSL